MSYLPPSQPALATADAIIALITSPKEAKVYLAGLKEAGEVFSKAKADYEMTVKNLESREAAVATKLEKVAAIEAALISREKEIERLRAEADMTTATAKQTYADNVKRARDIEAERQKLNHDKAHFEQTSKAATTVLSDREAVLAKEAAAHSQRVRQLKELVHGG